MVARPERQPCLIRARSWDVVARDVLRPGATFQVHSVFERAFNLVSPSGELLGIVVAPTPNGPATLVVSAPSFSYLVAQGDPARVDGMSLTIGQRLRIEMQSVRLWDPRAVRHTLSGREISGRLRRCAEIAVSLAPAGGMATLLDSVEAIAAEAPPPGPLPIAMERGSKLFVSPSPAARERGSGGEGSSLVERHGRVALRHLATAIRDRRWNDCLAPARALSGLGPGLTPSGDDVLAGLALGLHAGFGRLPGPLAAALLAAVDGRTTDLAVARVRHAVAGRPDERVHDLLTVLLTRDGQSLPAAVRAALDYGHSSGADTLVGLLVGLWLTLGDETTEPPLSQAKEGAQGEQNSRWPT